MSFSSFSFFFLPLLAVRFLTLASLIYFVLQREESKRSPPALARRHHPFPGNDHGVEPDVVLLHGDAGDHLLREREADEQRARARVLLDLNLGLDARGGLFSFRRCLLLRPPRAVGPRVVVAQTPPEPPALPVEGDPGEEEGVDVC